jgi:hypothetical protein
MNLIFGVRSDVVSLGRHWEDGEEMIGYVGYVVAEDPAGRRWAHNRSYTHQEPEGAEAQADVLCQRIEAAGGKINLAYWTEIDPAYGSRAYQVLDDDRYFRNREITQALDAGEINEYTANRLMAQ